MLQALLADMLDAGYTDLICTRDQRLGKMPWPVTTIYSDNNREQLWSQVMLQSDAVWIIAPETDNILLNLTCLAEQTGCQIFGCSSKEIRLATSKSLTLEHLSNANISCVPAINPSEISDSREGWVVKPDDGVGGEDCYFFKEKKQLLEYLANNNDKLHLVQEFVPGIPASISAVFLDGKATVLACNQQLYDFENNRGHLHGVVVNGLTDYQDQFTVLAGQIAASLPGATGYLGIDLVITPDGPRVVEINPRLTTAYVGLRQSLGINPASYIINSILDQQLLQTDLKSLRSIPVSLD